MAQWCEKCKKNLRNEDEMKNIPVITKNIQIKNNGNIYEIKSKVKKDNKWNLCLLKHPVTTKPMLVRYIIFPAKNLYPMSSQGNFETTSYEKGYAIASFINEEWVECSPNGLKKDFNFYTVANGGIFVITDWKEIN